MIISSQFLKQIEMFELVPLNMISAIRKHRKNPQDLFKTHTDYRFKRNDFELLGQENKFHNWQQIRLNFDG